MTSENKIYHFLVTIVIGFTTVLCWQGRTRELPFMYDNLVNVDEADKFLTQGRLPVYGGLSTTGGHNPPGISWMYMPGLLTGNPFYYQSVGASIAHCLTLIGIYLVLLQLGDPRSGLIACTLYGFSLLGFGLFGQMLWPKCAPFIAVWMVWFLIRWINLRSHWSLCVSLFLYAINCYLYLEFVPVAIVFPILWCMYKPPLRIYSLLITALMIIVVWYPYLKYEVKNNFSDIWQQLFMRLPKEIMNQDFENHASQLSTWDDSTNALGEYQPLHLKPEAENSFLKRFFFRFFYFFNNWKLRLEYNLGSWGWIWVLMIYGGIVAELAANFVRYADNRWIIRIRWIIGLGLVFAGMLCNPWLGTLAGGRALEQSESAKVWTVGLFFLLNGLVIYPWIGSAKLLILLQKALPDDKSETSVHRNSRMIFWLMYVPCLLSISTVAIVPRYLYWMWSWDTIALSIVISYLPRVGLKARLFSYALEFLCVGMLLMKTPVIGGVTNWYAEGFQGKMDPCLVALNKIVEHDIADGKANYSIGYHVYFNYYERFWNQYDTLYRLGAPYDLYLYHRYRIKNSHEAPKGFTAEDRYRLYMKVGSAAKHHIYKIDDRDQFEVIEDGEKFQIWKRR